MENRQSTEKEINFICPFCSLICILSGGDESCSLYHEYPTCRKYEDNDVETYMELSLIESDIQDKRRLALSN